jgi:hypothetical protein
LDELIDVRHLAVNRGEFARDEIVHFPSDLQVPGGRGLRGRLLGLVALLSFAQFLVAAMVSALERGLMAAQGGEGISFALHHFAENAVFGGCVVAELQKHVEVGPFQPLDAIEPPLGIENLLDQEALMLVAGAELGLERLRQALVLAAIFKGQNRGGGCESMRLRVLACDGFAGLGARSGGVLRVLLVDEGSALAAIELHDSCIAWGVLELRGMESEVV